MRYLSLKVTPLGKYFGFILGLVVVLLFLFF